MGLRGILGSFGGVSMHRLLKYGIDESVELELPDAAVVAFCDAPRGEALVDVAGAVRQCLEHPLHFPPLASAAVPGDKVVLALGPGVPQAAKLVAGVVEAVLQAGVAAKDITLLLTADQAAAESDDPLADVAAETRSQITRHVHDPANRDALSYLAADADAQPIYINRDIHDADLVISIGAVQRHDALAYHGAAACVFPTFTDAARQARYRSPAAAASAKKRELLRRQADEVTWLLGAQFTVQVVPGAGDEILHVCAGDVEAVGREAEALCEAAWSYPVPRRAALVIAAIEGGSAEQSWSNVARALSAAADALSDTGSVVLCTDLAQLPGPAMQQLAGTDDAEAALREIGKQRPIDALPATQLARALARGSVYLVSRLADDTVEELGMAPLDIGQLSRLAGRFDTCVILANAQHAVARADQIPSIQQPTSAR